MGKALTKERRVFLYKEDTSSTEPQEAAELAVVFEWYYCSLYLLRSATVRDITFIPPFCLLSQRDDSE